MNAWSFVSAALFMLSAIRADVVFCETGDQLHGAVLSVDEKEVRVRSEIAGELKVPRDKVLSITFGKGVKGVQRVVTTNVPSLKAAPKVTDADGKLDGEAIAKVQQDFLATATPEAQQMYQEMVKGFLSGKLSVQDLRGQAQDALNQLNELNKELGDDEIGDILGSYGSILQNFLKQTGGAATNLPAEKSVPAQAEPSDEE
jgi:hypothetical protein